MRGRGMVVVTYRRRQNIRVAELAAWSKGLRDRNLLLHYGQGKMDVEVPRDVAGLFRFRVRMVKRVLAGQYDL